MSLVRRFPSRAWLLSVTALSGCLLLSCSAWQGPSPLSGPPPPRVRQERQDSQGGFVVLVGSPGQPTAARVIADIEAFARQRGFVRSSAASAPSFDPATHQPLPAAAQRYLWRNIVLEVAYQPADLRVSAYLHGGGFELSRKFADGFYRDFDREHAGRYGDEDPIIESDYVDNSANPFAGTAR